MSRVRVLNLSKSTTEQSLKDHVIQAARSSRGSMPQLDITDCKIMRNDAGAIRMAFLGFRSAAAGAAVVKLLNGSFIGSQKIAVETAMGVADAKGVKTQAERKRVREEIVERKKGNVESEPEEKGGKKKIKKMKGGAVADDDEPLVDLGKALGHDESSEAQPLFKRRRKESTAADDGPSEVPSKDSRKAKAKSVLSEKSKKAKEGEFQPSWADMVPTEPDAAASTTAQTTAAAEPDTIEDALEKQQRLQNVSDGDFLSNLMFGGGGAQPPPSIVVEDKPKEKPADPRDRLGTSSDQPVSTKEEKKGKDKTLPATPKQATNRLRITNIPFSATESDLKNYFSSKCGTVKAVHVPLTKDTKQSKGSAFVEFPSVDAATDALTTMHNSIFMGRLIKVDMAKPDPYAAKKEARLAAERAATAAALGNVEGLDDETREAQMAEGSFKYQRAEQRKDADQKGLVQHNALYLSSNAALETMAGRLKTDAANLVNVDSGGAAVRAAVAEAILTSEAKRVLGEEGIDMELMAPGANALHRDRSKSTIVVKNIAPGVSTAEVTGLFKRVGDLDTVAAASSGSFMIVSFLNANDADKAFQRLAYKKMRGQPLYLEWAPLGVLKDDDIDDADKEHQDAGGPSTAGSSCTLYVTNLPWGMREDDFHDFLKDVAPRFVKQPQLITKMHLVPERGRAFVTLSDRTSMNYLTARLAGRSLEGRELACEEAKSSGRGVPQQQQTRSSGIECPPGKDPLKLIVKNLPFEATEADLRQLFASFTEVRSVRVPKRLHSTSQHHSNQHRGFGFVEFLTEQEAVQAIEQLSNTHLYGRHLVLEFASKTSQGV